MGHYEPSNISPEKLFSLPPEHRPYIELSLLYPTTDQVSAWPKRLRPALTGVHRFANLIIGLAAESEAEGGVAPQHMSSALAAGNIIVQGMFYTDRTCRDGSLFASGHVQATQQVVSVKSFTEGLTTQVEFVRMIAEWNRPYYATTMAWKGEAVESQTHVDLPLVLRPGQLTWPPDSPIPLELRAAAIMGSIEERITGGFESLGVRTQVFY